MWKCCLPKIDNVIEQSENEEDINDRSNSEGNLNSNSQHKFYEDFKELIESYENNEGDYIDMSQPRDASYATVTSFNFDREILETTRLGKDISLTSMAKHEDGIKNESFDPRGYRSMPTEVRGITLRQLRAILPLIKRRCEEENWTRTVYKDGKETDDVEMVTLEKATMYDINTYIIKPFTEYSQKSFVETLPSTKGTQPPRWFVSHYWGETFVHTMACLEWLVQDFHDNITGEQDDNRRGGGMTEDTPVWICSFANNQHNIHFEITTNPADSAFAKAMKIANFRVISILDVNNQVYTRLWCMYELYLTLLLSREEGIDGVLAIYTYYEYQYVSLDLRRYYRSAVGIIKGGAPSDTFDGCDNRQKYFPRERLLKFLSVSIQNAEASWDEDRKHILNSLVGRKGANLDAEPLKHHDCYDTLNEAIRGAVFSSQATLNLVYETGERRYWNSALNALEQSNGKEFLFNAKELPLLTKEAMAQVFHHLPIGLDWLSIIKCPHGRVAMDALLDWLENKSTNLKFLNVSDTCIGGEVGGKECGERLARFLARNDCKIETIHLKYTDLLGSRNVDTWIDCFEKNQNQSLKDVSFDGMANFVEQVGESEKSYTSIDAPDNRGKIYWDGTTFPDATLSIEQQEALKETESKCGVFFFQRVGVLEEFVLEDSGEESSTLLLEVSDGGESTSNQLFEFFRILEEELTNTTKIDVALRHDEQDK